MAKVEPNIRFWKPNNNLDRVRCAWSHRHVYKKLHIHTKSVSATAIWDLKKDNYIHDVIKENLKDNHEISKQ